jgi:spermidine synthase
MSREITTLNENLVSTASQVFALQKIIPDEYNIVLLSNGKNSFTVENKVLSKRLLKRKISTRLISKSHLDYKLNAERADWFWNEIKDTKSIHINSDLHPIALYYNLVLLHSIHSPQFADIYSQLQYISFWYVILGIVLFFILLHVILRRFKKYKNMNIIIPILTTGFVSMGVTIVLFLTFQSFYGYIYQWIGLIITAFMLGLTVGGLIITRLLEQRKIDNTLYFKIEALILFYCLLLLSLLGILNLLEEFSFISILIKFIILSLSLSCGFLMGLQFPLANKLYLREKDKITQTAGILYSSDLIGAWIGGLLVSIVFIPIY